MMIQLGNMQRKEFGKGQVEYRANEGLKTVIPHKIGREHVLKAIREVDQRGIPARRGATKFHLVFNGRNYPPKYILALADRYATGKELRPSEFGGGQETNGFLQRLGFVIEGVSAARPVSSTASCLTPRRDVSRRTRHDERCPACKETVYRLLQTIYGKVEKNFRFEVGTTPEEYECSPHHSDLKEIYSALANLRGFTSFVKSPNLTNCDFFIPKPGFIVEFDESQHFTECRRLALEKYPEGMRTGFNRQQWTSLCGELQSRDNDPPYRDEQRAWYDTLRDFLPATKGLKPTVRLYAGAQEWCSLNPSSRSDVKMFKGLLEGVEKAGRAITWNIQVRGDACPFLGRIVIDGTWEGGIESGRSLLRDVVRVWPRGQQVQCLITPGAFVRFWSPDSLPDTDDNLNPDKATIEQLFSETRTVCKTLLTNELMRDLSKCTRYLTLGVDSKKQKNSQTQNYIPERHVEMVCLVDLVDREFHVTGKSYPTSRQADTLIRIPCLETHFLNNLACGKTMVLGCHDLSIYSPRGQATARGRRRILNNTPKFPPSSSTKNSKACKN